MSDERMKEMSDLWELAYKNLVGDCSDRLTIEEIACMFFELGFRAADESSK